MSISSELLTLNNTKQSIKASINAKGGNITNSTPFADYSTAIDNLPSGGSGNPLLTSIDVSDFSGTTFNRVANYITDVTIPSGVTKIGYEGFYQVNRLSSIVLPNSLTSIGDRAFMGCSSLQSISIPNTVTSIGENAFSESGITSFSFPPNITNSNRYGANMLSNCKNLQSVDFGNIPEIKVYMCYGCTSLTSITIPNTVTSISSNAFALCNGLTSITIPDNVTLMESSFYECTGLRSVTIGSGLQYFRGTVFMNCTNLEHIIIKATTPPSFNYTNALVNTNNCPIYVPAASVAAYKAASGWSTYESRIYGIAQVATVDNTPVYNYDLGMTSTTMITSTNMQKMPTGTSLELAEGIIDAGGSFGNYTSITLPSTFTSFDDQGMIGNTTTTLTCLATTPPTAERNDIGGANLTAIYVPAASVSDYQADAAWSGFSSIIQAIPTE